MNISTFFSDNKLGTYPSIFPDFNIQSPSLKTKDGEEIIIQGGIKPQDIIFAEFDLTIIDKMIPIEDQVQTTITFITNGTIMFVFNTGSFVIPAGNNKLKLSDTSVQLRFSPKNHIAGFEASGSFPLNVFGSQHTAKASMDIQLTEAAVSSVELGFSVAPGEINLLSFFGKGYIKGGVIGAFFEPPGIIMGMTGSYDGRLEFVRTPSHECTIVCDVEGDVPIPLYVSSYFYRISMGELLQGITPTSYSFFKKIYLHDTYITWCAKSVMLPNGTMAPKGESFQTYANILGFEFYGSIIKTDDDLTGAFQSDRIELLSGAISITGNGKKIEPKKRGKELALHDSMMLSPLQRSGKHNKKPFVEAGGPVLNFSIGKKKVPSVVASGNVSFLEKKLLQLESKIINKQIALFFKFDNGFNGCSGAFQISTAQVVGQINIGSLSGLVNYIENKTFTKLMSIFGSGAKLGTSIRLTNSGSIFIANTYVEFNGEKIFHNLNTSLNLGYYSTTERLVKNIAPTLSKLPLKLLSKLAKNPTIILKMVADKILNQAIFSDAVQLLSSFKVLHIGYNDSKKILNEIGNTLHIGTENIKAVITGIEELSGGMISASKIGVLLNQFNIENLDENMIAQRAEFITTQLKNVLEASQYEVVKALKEIDIDLTVINDTVINVYDLNKEGVKILADIYGELGYATDDVVDVFEDAGGFCSDVGNELKNLGNTMNPVNWWPF